MSFADIVTEILTIHIDGKVSLYDPEKFPLVGMKVRWRLLSPLDQLLVDTKVWSHITMEFELTIRRAR